MTDRQAETEIRDLFDAYGAGFDDADVGAVTDLFAWPATIWQFGEGHVFDEPDDLAENVEALMDVFEDAGIVVTTPVVRDLRVARAAAYAHVDWRQEDQAGDVLHEFTCQYILIRSDGDWRIATVVNESDPGEAAAEG